MARVKVLMGLKGSGKTKQLIELVTNALTVEHGHVVCIEKERKLTFDIPSGARLITASDYSFSGPELLKGFISGLYAGNYDITHIILDSLYKIAPFAGDVQAVTAFLDWLNSFGDANNIKFTVSISADVNGASEGIRKYF
ncbi:MAG: hypothetical protein LBN97_07485 [Oscillospiraceae bacterium]|jgi:hypothetical protein|nr:hypothetical protein [Oscillospiraceae bacterium]